MSIRRDGFTLIEIIMALLILGILAAVAIPYFLDISTQAQNTTDDYTITAIKQVITNLYLDSIINGMPAYPTFPEIADNLHQPTFYSGLTAGEWSYLSFFGGNIIIIYCPHGTTAAGRRIWLYFRTTYGSWAAGTLAEFGSGPHL